MGQQATSAPVTLEESVSVALQWPQQTLLPLS